MLCVAGSAPALFSAGRRADSSPPPKESGTLRCGRELGRPVTGRLELDEWQARDGSNRSRVYVIGERIEFLGR
jgi:hypothetical protein